VFAVDISNLPMPSHGIYAKQVVDWCNGDPLAKFERSMVWRSRGYIVGNAHVRISIRSSKSAEEESV
jgi:hypothetical protein